MAWTLDYPSYDSVSLSVSGQASSPVSVAFSTDGLKMFVVRLVPAAVFQYTLSTSFDLSTASYDSVSLSATSQDGATWGIAFSPNGLKMYLTGISSNIVLQYSLSSSFDLSTASYDSVLLSVGSQDGTPAGLAFSPDGFTMFVVGLQTGAIYQYALSTSFDLSTASYSSVSFSVTGQDFTPGGVALSPDGLTMFVYGNATDSVYQYTLSSSFDVSTASYDSLSFSTATQDTDSYGIAVGASGSKMYIVGDATNSLYQYSLNTAGPPVVSILVASSSVDAVASVVSRSTSLLESTATIIALGTNALQADSQLLEESILSADPRVDRGFTGLLVAASSLIAEAGLIPSSTIAMTSTATLTGIGSKFSGIPVSLESISTVVGEGTRTLSTSVDLTGEAILDGIVSTTKVHEAVLIGSSSLLPIASAITAFSANLVTETNLSAAGIVRSVSTVNLNSTGTITGLASRSLGAASELAGVASLNILSNADYIGFLSLVAPSSTTMKAWIDSGNLFRYLVISVVIKQEVQESMVLLRE